MLSSLGLYDAAVLFFLAVVAGAINAVSGGGSFISFPALIAIGVPAVPANATNTVAMLPWKLRQSRCISTPICQT